MIDAHSWLPRKRKKFSGYFIWKIEFRLKSNHFSLNNRWSLLYMLREDKSSLKIVFHDRHNRRETDNLILAENLRIRIDVINHNIVLWKERLKFFLCKTKAHKEKFDSYRECHLDERRSEKKNKRKMKFEFELNFQEKYRRFNFTTNFQWSFEFEKNWLTEKDFSRFQAQIAHFIFTQMNVFVWFSTANWKKRQLNTAEQFRKTNFLLHSSNRWMMLSIFSFSWSLLILKIESQDFEEGNSE